MFTKTYHWCLASMAVLLVGILVLAGYPGHALALQASFQAQSNNSSCLTCHEDLYYLHDTGKSYCITVHKDRCVNCHEGNPVVLNKVQSHLGLIAHPQKNNGEKCQECHAQDAQAHLATFASMGGYKPVVEAVSYAPSRAALVGFPEMLEPNQLAEKLPWVLGAVILFGLWLALVFLSPQKP
jgi:hypothetical protein